MGLRRSGSPRMSLYCLRRLVGTNRRRPSGKTGCAFQSESLSSTGDGFPESIAQGSSSRGKASQEACAQIFFDGLVEIPNRPLLTSLPPPSVT
ncbi:jg20409 [Pararge aegeria aegeria]|uniref:Jg20409 protein n=1 Tax=Pararge aegeria aegeria TaxID=348720 RepID=A0A8S4R419_9NEOP|nr:jg20409 [Pararge aegeria aegeria]